MEVRSANGYLADLDSNLVVLETVCIYCKATDELLIEICRPITEAIGYHKET